MRRFSLLAALIVLALATIFTCGGFGLALAKPLLPGSPFFQMQYTAEQALVNFIKDPAGRAFYFMNLVEKRNSDFVLLAGTKRASTALEYLSLSIDQVSRAFAAAPPEDYALLHLRLMDLVQQVDSAMTTHQVSKGENAEIYNKLKVKIDALKMLLGMAESSSASSEPPSLDENQAILPMVANKGDPVSPAGIDPRMVQFPPGSPGALHAFFPLTGKHAVQGCADCHVNGHYAGTPTQCEACHNLDKPVDHFAGDCASCHVTSDWALVHFDHSLAGTNDCESCHAVDKPAHHFSGQCSLCHSTTDWKQATFNHQAVGATDCQSCHLKNRPANHFDGQCSACHNTSNWAQASFNHQAVGAADCQDCHSKDRPVNHFDGECSACHNTNRWQDASFDHAAARTTDCGSCHSKDKPSNHFDGQCSSCHSTSSWKGASFDHQAVGAIDCQSCHSKDRPSGHFGGQCSACHNTSSWPDASFDHQAAGATDCQSCHNQDKPSNHFDGQCSACHNTSSWSDATFDHQAAGVTDCQSCHNQDKPANHYDGQCSDCHNTASWPDASFNHSFPIDHGGANGDCAKCHPKTTAKWTCYTCHDKGQTESKHSEEGILDIADRCLDCHSGGKEDD